MSTARRCGSRARNWFQLEKRFPAGRTARLAVAAVLAVGAAAVPVLTPTAGPASAGTNTETFDNAGTYTAVVPQYTTSFSVTGLGGAGLSGQPAAGGVSSGGKGGSGSYVSETFSPIPISIGAGDILNIVVGAAGGGAAGGTGDGLSRAGGAGGGYTYISDETTGETILIAAGGGGGGGGSGLFADYIGGNGGTDGGGSAGLGQYGQANGAGGAEGPYCPNSIPAMNEGSPGQNAPTASADGGGGGGGGGGCGGSGGKASLGSGGGGGGSGYSVLDPAATSKSLSSGTNTGDGSASITFVTAPPSPVAPVIDSPNCLYSANGTGSQIGFVSAKAWPAATLSLVGQPSWLALTSQTNSTNSDGTLETHGTLSAVGTVVDGQYTFPVEATNDQGSAVQPFTLVEEPGITAPSFVSAASATATAGQLFRFQVSAVGCPPLVNYAISQNSTDVPWLTMSGDGVLSGTPTAADAGTHTITLSASPAGVVGSTITQTFTLTVNGPPVTVPGAPTIGTATAGDAQAAVAFTPPADDGGSPITSYTVTAKDATDPASGGQAATGTGSPITVTGLTNGDSYTFTVKATNVAGTGPASAPSNAVTPAAPVTVPGAPAIDAVQPGHSRVRVIFRAPKSNGGSPITRYTVTATDLTRGSRGGQTVTGKRSPITVTGLTNGDSYTFTVKATNAAGTGPASAPSKAVTPATVPGAPVIEHVTAGNGAARVIFRAPRNDGGVRITRYTVTARDLTCPSRGGQTVTGKRSPITVTGLRNGDRYTFTVKAANAAGTGPASAPSKAVTPRAPKPSADLTTALTRHPAAKDGSVFTETVTVTNHGPRPAPDAVTKVFLPRQFTAVATHGGKQTGWVISWTAASLGTGKSVSYTVTVKVAAHAHGTVLIAATSISKAVDPKPLNNRARTAIKLG
jgi:large repetitive protein